MDIFFERWSRLGVAFGAIPSQETPDPEALIIDTARHAADAPRLFIMAATWLHEYGQLISKHRLKHLIRAKLAPEHAPVLGLLLDIAQRGTHPPRFQSVIACLAPAPSAHPLFNVESGNEQLRERARRRSSEIGRRWNLWCEPFEFKTNAIRPARWVLANNPGLVARADFRGDLRASILAALRHDPGAGDSEMNLARCAGGSRAQVRSSLENLELSGKVRRVRGDHPRKTRIALVEAPEVLAAARERPG